MSQGKITLTGGDATRVASGDPAMWTEIAMANRESLAAILRNDAFLAGDTTTAFLDEHPEVAAILVYAPALK